MIFDLIHIETLVYNKLIDLIYYYNFGNLGV